MIEVELKPLPELDLSFSDLSSVIYSLFYVSNIFTSISNETGELSFN